MSNFISIKEAAKTLGVTPKTLRTWELQGKISSVRTEGNHRRYDLNKLLNIKSGATLTIAYARVSTHGQKDDLTRQVSILESYCANKGWAFEIIKDFGTEVFIINRSEDSSFEEDLTADVLEIITVFSARLYGSRSHKNKNIIDKLQAVAKEIK